MVTQNKAGVQRPKKVFRFVAIMLALSLISTGFASAQNTSQKVELQFYMLGDPPKDLPVIAAEINKLAEKDLNATIKFNYVPWAGWDQKYNLLLTSGQPIDLIFTAEWTKYSYYAKRGAFMDIGPLVPKAAPALYKFVSADYWNAVKVGGKIYTVPATWKEYVNNGVVYREDLRKKYNLPKPDSIANMEAYFDGIKKNVPDMQPTYQIKDFPMLDEALMSQVAYVESPLGTPPAYGLRYDYRTPSKLYNYFESPQFLADMKIAKRWADKGFWSRSALSQDTPADALQTGKAASRIDGMNPVKLATLMSNTANGHPDWEWGYVPFSDQSKLVHPVHPVHNGFAIARTSKNPERALMFYEKLVTDKRYNFLTEYGIEGKNYKIVDGYYEMIGDSSSNGFGREAMNGWAWRNPQIQIFAKSFDVPFKFFKEFDKIATPNIRDGFAEDVTPYQAEQAAFNQVWTQYGIPIYYGLAGDPEAAIKNFIQKAKAAGWDKIVTEFGKQWAEYAKDQGLK